MKPMIAAKKALPSLRRWRLTRRLLLDGFSMSHPQLREWVPACRQGFTPAPLTEGGFSKVPLAKLIGIIPPIHRPTKILNVPLTLVINGNDRYKRS